MLQQVPALRTQLRVLLHDQLYELLRLFRDRYRVVYPPLIHLHYSHLYAYYLVHYLLLLLALEGDPTRQQLVRQHANAPYVH